MLDATCDLIDALTPHYKDLPPNVRLAYDNLRPQVVAQYGALSRLNKAAEQEHSTEVKSQADKINLLFVNTQRQRVLVPNKEWAKLYDML